MASEDRLGDRYCRIVGDARSLLWDTVRYPFSSRDGPDNQIHDEATSVSSVPSSPSVSTPAQTPKPDVSIASGSQHDITDVMLIAPRRKRKRIPSPDHLPSLPPTSRTPSCSSSHVLSSDLIHLDGLHFQSTPKRRTPSTTPIRSSNLSREPTLNGVMDHLTLQSDCSSLASSSHCNSPSSSRASTHQLTRHPSASRKHSSRPRRREHLLKDAHTAAVRKSRKEALMKQSFELKKATGYQSTYSVFKDHIQYRWKLDKLNLEDAPLRPHPSYLFTTGDLPPPRSEEGDDHETEYLKRYIHNAKATLAAGKPPKFSLPTYDRVKDSHLVRDKAIDRLLHPTPPAKLPPEVDEAVNVILRKRGIVAKFAREQISDMDISRLKPGQWLNDEIVNFYGALILARSEGRRENRSKGNGPVKKLNVHYFSSFFWSKLIKEGYEQGRLAKWTKKVDIFSKDVILIPVNHSNAHWTAAAINFRRKRIESYDSMGLAKDIVFIQLRSYLDAEHKEKKMEPFDFTGWETLAPDHTPQQENGYDCGVFTCHFLEALSRGEETFTFCQSDMPLLRRRMIWEIGNAHLRPPYE